MNLQTTLAPASVLALPSFEVAAARFGPRTERIIFDGRPAWLKRAERTSFPLAPLVQKAFGSVVGMPPLLQCTYVLDRKEALAFERSRLSMMAAQGYPVPHVLAHRSDYLVTSEVGRSIWDTVKQMDSVSRVALLEQGAAALAALHVGGGHHGQPYPKNMTWDGRRVHFIDLEDDVLSVMSEKDAQMRDIWMMVHGCWPFSKDATELSTRLVRKYADVAGRAIVANIKERLPQLAGTRSAALHAAISPNVSDNRARYLWTLEGVAKGLVL
ncbi:MAG: hypothetical protein EBQ96_03340 [Proteobacteria bacterium]|nr:hypothetical protein [Pseudomonadota bacterium]